jgi:hypothetical protein
MMTEKAMSQTIQPGTTVEVKVVQRPRSKGARSTLGRLFLRDPAIRKERGEKKPLRLHQRGGRQWRARPKGSDVRVPELGDTCTIRASVDAIRDLSSVSDCVSVTPK